MIIVQLDSEQLSNLIKNSVRNALAENSNPINDNGTNTEQHFNVKALCAYLPNKPKPQTVYRWMSANKIPYHKNGKFAYFIKTEIDEWLKQGKVKTKAERIEDAANFINPKTNTDGSK